MLPSLLEIKHKCMSREGFEPSKNKSIDLQSIAFNHSAIDSLNKKTLNKKFRLVLQSYSHITTH